MTIGQEQTSITLPSMLDSGGNPSSSFPKDAPQTSTSGFLNRKRSIFSSAQAADKEIQDVNYNVKGTNENKRIAWEIKFNEKPQSGADTSENPDASTDFIYSELQKHRQNKSPRIKFRGPNESVVKV